MSLIALMLIVAGIVIIIWPAIIAYVIGFGLIISGINIIIFKAKLRRLF